MTLVGPCDWCLSSGVTTLLSSSSTVVSGACLYVWLSVAAGPLHRISRGAHEMLSLVRTAWRREMWVWLLFMAPGSWTALPVTGLTSNCSAVRRCAMSPRVSSLAWHMRSCYACKCEVSF